MTSFHPQHSSLVPVLIISCQDHSNSLPSCLLFKYLSSNCPTTYVYQRRSMWDYTIPLFKIFLWHKKHWIKLRLMKPMSCPCSPFPLACSLDVLLPCSPDAWSIQTDLFTTLQLTCGPQPTGFSLLGSFPLWASPSSPSPESVFLVPDKYLLIQRTKGSFLYKIFSVSIECNPTVHR